MFSDLTPLVCWLGVLSAFLFIISLVIIPWYFKKLPADFFLQLQKTQPKNDLTPRSLLILIGLNIIGLFFVIAGVIMLFIPGQGLLTILIGLIIMSFPGKKRLLIFVISLKKVQKSLDWSRRKLSCVPFIWR